MPVFTPPAATDPATFSQPVAQDDGKSAEQVRVACLHGDELFLPLSLTAPPPHHPPPPTHARATRLSQDDFEKLKNDLVVVEEKIKLCREMLPQSPGIETDDTLAEVIGFLEGCKPRMVDLIEAGMQGMLDEGLLGMALAINDDLLKTLEAEENGTPLPPMSPSIGGGGGGAAEPDLLGEQLASVTLVGEDDEPQLQGRRVKKGGAPAAAPDPFAAASPADGGLLDLMAPVGALNPEVSVSVVPPGQAPEISVASVTVESPANPFAPMPGASPGPNPFNPAPMPMGGAQQAPHSVDPFAAMGQPAVTMMGQPVVQQVPAQQVLAQQVPAQQVLAQHVQTLPPPPPPNAQQNFDPFA